MLCATVAKGFDPLRCRRRRALKLRIRIAVFCESNTTGVEKETCPCGPEAVLTFSTVYTTHPYAAFSKLKYSTVKIMSPE